MFMLFSICIFFNTNNSPKSIIAANSDPNRVYVDEKSRREIFIRLSTLRPPPKSIIAANCDPNRVSVNEKSRLCREIFT